MSPRSRSSRSSWICKGSCYGKPGVLENTDGNAALFTFNATTKGAPLAWQSVSGSYSTSKKGVSGELEVMLDRTNGQPGRLVVKGTWQHCRVGGNI